MPGEQSKTRRVLSIDGGGFRGLACLLILQHVMRELASQSGEEEDEENPTRPCDLFDLIGGTSTGGLVAILLGRFGLTCEEAIAVYKELGPAIFGENVDSGQIWGAIVNGERFSSASYEQELQNIVMKFTGRADALMKPLKNHQDTVTHRSTATFVTVVSQIGSAGVDAYRIRSYPRPSGEIDPAPSGHKWTVFEAARGTSAAPMYFAPLIIKSGAANYVFQDAGASGFNNPARVVMEEAEKKFGDDTDIMLISLGTGLGSLLPEGKLTANSKPEVKDEDAQNFATRILASFEKTVKNIKDAPQIAKRLATQLLKVATDTEITHLHTFEQFKREGRRQSYYRFNPPQGLGDIDLSDYKKEVAISAITDAWLKSPAGKESTLQAANSMKARYEEVQAEVQALEMIQ